MTARLPTPGSDNNSWGDVLNSYLLVSHDGTGLLLSSAISSAGGALSDSPTLTGTPKAPTAAVGVNTNQIATTAFVQSTVAGSGILSYVYYSPVSGSSYTIQSTTLAPIDNNHLSLPSFAAPTSGKVWVEYSAFIADTGNSGTWFQMMQSGTGIGTGLLMTKLSSPGVAPSYRKELITGLTPGQQYSWVLGWHGGSSSDTKYLYYGGTDGPIYVAVLAA